LKKKKESRDTCGKEDAPSCQEGLTGPSEKRVSDASAKRTSGPGREEVADSGEKGSAVTCLKVARSPEEIS
jgi:hypothetical protein